MNRMHLALVAWLMIVAGAAAGSAPASDDATNIFILKRTGDELAIEVVPIAPGAMQVVQTSDEVIDLIFPPSAGQSAGLISPAEGRMLVVRNTGEDIRVEVRSPDGSKRDLPARRIDDLARYDIRVSVSGIGRRAAFLITGNETVQRDVGPVANMFAGRVPAAALQNAYVVQTETYARDAGPLIAGTVPLAIDRWPIVRVTLPNGTQADFIVDIGAGTTVMDKSLVPDDVEIEPSAMIEYSMQGRRELKYAPGGATGAVQSIVGHAALDRLTLGDLDVAGVTVDVMEKLPDMFGRPVGGILGMDVMRRCGRLGLTLGGDAAELRFDAEALPSGEAIELPFAFVSTHLCIEGQVNGTPVYFVLDTGAPTSFLDEATAHAAGVEGDVSKATEGRGLDEGSATIVPASMGTLTLGAEAFEDIPCRISALPAFDKLRTEDQHIGLIGDDFFARFSRIEIDFAHRTVRFVK